MMQKLKKLMKNLAVREGEVFIRSLLAGLSVCLGTTVFLSVAKGKVDDHESLQVIQRIFAAMYFAFALLIIIKFKMWLFTGKVGFITDNVLEGNWLYFLDLLVCLIGNCFGTWFLTNVMLLTRQGKDIDLQRFVGQMAHNKRVTDLFSMLILGIYCGFMIYIAVRGQKVEGDFTKAIFTFFAVIVFVCSTYEHSIANFSFFTYAGFQLGDFIITIVLAIGNLIGAVLLDGLLQIAAYLLKKLEAYNKPADLDEPKKLEWTRQHELLGKLN